MTDPHSADPIIGSAGTSVANSIPSLPKLSIRLHTLRERRMPSTDNLYGDGNEATNPLPVFSLWQRKLISTEQALERASELAPGELRELILNHQDTTWRRGESTPAAKYFEQYPVLANDQSLQADILFNEFKLRS